MAAPTRFVICGKNALDSATISTTAGVEIAGNPLSNLTNIYRARNWRSRATSVATSEEIKLTWGGTGNYVNFVMMHRHNLEGADTWRVQLYSDAAWTTQIADSGTVAAVDTATLGSLDWGIDPLGSNTYDAFLGQKQSVYYPSSRLNTLSAKITITYTGNSAGYALVNRFYLGDAMEAAVNPKVGLKLGWKNDGATGRTPGGTLRSEQGVSFRQLTLSFDKLSDTERAQWSDLTRYCGTFRDMFLSVYPGASGERERDHMMLAKFVGELPELSTDFYTRHSTSLKLQEI